MHSFSLRTKKLRSMSFSRALNHNFRKSTARSVNQVKSHLNVYQTGFYFSDKDINTYEDLWRYVRTDFLDKKKSSYKLGRFLKRSSTKKTKYKNNDIKYIQVETSIAREFVLQIGSISNPCTDIDLAIIYKKIAKFILEKYQLTVIQFTVHKDETTCHAHLIATTYDFEQGKFSKELNTCGSYSRLQKECYEYVNKNLMQIKPYVIKTSKKTDYINPQEWNKKFEFVKNIKGLDLVSEINDLSVLIQEQINYKNNLIEMHNFLSKNKEVIESKKKQEEEILILNSFMKL